MVTALSVADALARELEELGPFTATRLDRSALDDPGVVRSRDLLDPERLLACAIAAGDIQGARRDR